TNVIDHAPTSSSDTQAVAPQRDARADGDSPPVCRERRREPRGHARHTTAIESNGYAAPRPTLRDTPPHARTGLHLPRRADPGARHRREQRHLQRGQCGPVAPAALSRARADRPRIQYAPRRAHPALGTGLLPDEGRDSGLRVTRRLHLLIPEPDWTRRAGAPEWGLDQRFVLRRPGRASRAG